MAKAKGYQGLIGFQKATTWGTAVAAGALSGLKVIDCKFSASREIVPNMQITGTVSQQEGDKGNLVVAGSLNTPLFYEGCQKLIAALLGTAGVPATVDTSARLHTITPAATTDGNFWTLAYEVLKDTLIYEYNTVKVTGITLRCQIPGHATLEVRGIAHDFTDASGINTTTTIDTVTVPTNREIAQARQLVVRINSQSGGALGATDVHYVSGVELVIERPLAADYTTEFGDRTSEPMPPAGGDAFLKVSGNMTFTQLDNAGTGGNSDVVMDQLTRATKKIDIVLTGDNVVGAATEKNSHKIYLPMVVFEAGEKPVLVAGALAWTLPFTSHHASAAPTGFPAGALHAVNWLNTNTAVADPLA